VFRRILLSFLLAWLGIAPAVASSCVAECQMSGDSAHAADHKTQPDVSGVPDCHGKAGQHEQNQNKQMPDGSSMAVACFVAAAVAIPTVAVPSVTIDLISEQRFAVLLPPLSFETSAPIKPPQA
jgi:hypothetical protein